MYRYITATYPEYWVRIFDLVTQVDEQSGRAIIHFTGETAGMIEGLTMPSVGSLEFKRYGREMEDWKCTCMRGARGMIDGMELI